MRRVSIRDLRYRFPEVERLIRAGATVELTRRRKVIARIQPSGHDGAVSKRPDFAAMLLRIYGRRTLRVSGAQLISRERDRY